MHRCEFQVTGRWKMEWGTPDSGLQARKDTVRTGPRQGQGDRYGTERSQCREQTGFCGCLDGGRGPGKEEGNFPG